MTIARAFENLVRANSELDDIQGSQLRRTHGLATELHRKLESLQANEVHTLVEAFGSIYNQLVSHRERTEYFRALIKDQQTTNELVALMNSRQNRLDEVRSSCYLFCVSMTSSSGF